MTSVVEGLRLLFSYLSISNAMVCQQYRVNLEVDNKVSIQPLWKAYTTFPLRLVPVRVLMDASVLVITLRQRCANSTRLTAYVIPLI